MSIKEANNYLLYIGKTLHHPRPINLTAMEPITWAVTRAGARSVLALVVFPSSCGVLGRGAFLTPLIAKNVETTMMFI